MQMFHSYSFLFCVLCAAFCALCRADELKPLRQASQEPLTLSTVNPADDFSQRLNDALNSPLNGPKEEKSGLAGSVRPLPFPKRTPPPMMQPETIMRGQSAALTENDTLSERPPHPQGTVNAEALDPKLLDDKLSGEGSSEISTVSTVTEAKPDSGASEVVKQEAETEASSKQWANAILLVTTIVTVMMLVYAVVMAYDYRQRWVQALITQNARFSLGGLEDSPSEPVV